MTIAYWAKTHHLGVFDQRRWKIDRAQLKRYLVDRFGAERLPRGLQA